MKTENKHIFFAHPQNLIHRAFCESWLYELNGGTMDKLSLLTYEYVEILAGNKKNYSDDYFNGNASANEQLAISFIREITKIFLQCNNLESAKIAFSRKLIDQMKLTKIITYITVPPYVDANDKVDYIISKIFTNNFNSERWTAERYCKRVLNGTISRFPKNYMFCDNGVERACFCLKYFLRTEYPRMNALQTYQFAASQEFSGWLKKHYLSNTCVRLFASPIDYVHLMLPDEMKNHMYYCMYLCKLNLRKACISLEKLDMQQEIAF